MRFSWQVPISANGVIRAHWFQRSKRTNIVVNAACGKLVNPGFAIEAPQAKRCPNCKYRLRK